MPSGANPLSAGLGRGQRAELQIIAALREMALLTDGRIQGDQALEWAHNVGFTRPHPHNCEEIVLTLKGATAVALYLKTKGGK